MCKKKNIPGTFVLVLRIRVGSIDHIPEYNRFSYKSTIVIAARNPNLQVVITYASHVCSQHSFGLPLRMEANERSLITRNLIRRVLTICHVKRTYAKHSVGAKTSLTFDRCRPHPVTFGYY